MKTILEELKEIEARTSALIKRLESDSKGIMTTVGEIRKFAVLEEVYRIGGAATPEEISSFARKYGKTASSTAGYYSGNKPSMVASDDRKLRLLTDTGKQTVAKARVDWGDDWLDRVPLEIIQNQYTPDSEVSF